MTAKNSAPLGMALRGRRSARTARTTHCRKHFATRPSPTLNVPRRLRTVLPVTKALPHNSSNARRDAGDRLAKTRKARASTKPLPRQTPSVFLITGRNLRQALILPCAFPQVWGCGGLPWLRPNRSRTTISLQGWQLHQVAPTPELRQICHGKVPSQELPEPSRRNREHLLTSSSNHALTRRQHSQRVQAKVAAGPISAEEATEIVKGSGEFLRASLGRDGE